MPNTVLCGIIYIAYVHAVPPTEGRLKKNQAHGFDSMPLYRQVKKRQEHPPDIKGEERIREM